MKDLLQKWIGILRKNIVLVIYFVLWAIMVGCYWLNETNADAFGYSLIAFYLILPIISFIAALIYGMGQNRIRYFLPFVFGIFETLGGFFTFQVSNVIANGEWNSWNIPDLQMCLYSLIPALVGLLVGFAVSRLRARLAGRKKQFGLKR